MPASLRWQGRDRATTAVNGTLLSRVQRGGRGEGEGEGKGLGGARDTGGSAGRRTRQLDVAAALRSRARRCTCQAAVRRAPPRRWACDTDPCTPPAAAAESAPRTWEGRRAQRRPPSSRTDAMPPSYGRPPPCARASRGWLRLGGRERCAPRPQNRSSCRRRRRRRRRPQGAPRLAAPSPPPRRPAPDSRHARKRRLSPPWQRLWQPAHRPPLDGYGCAPVSRSAPRVPTPSHRGPPGARCGAR